MAWATNKNISYLKSARIIICDDTFSITPAPFFQSYSFHVGFSSNKTLPMLYSLLPDKTKATYINLANILKDHCGDLSGITIY